MGTPSSTSSRRRRRRGATLGEIVTCAVVLGVLTALVAPAIAHGRRLARDASCKGQLKRLWIATSYYANNHNGALFVNRATPLRISNVVHRDGRATGWGMLYPQYLENYHVLFCAEDPGRGPAWEYGWSNWKAGKGEVQCSYGYRGRYGFARTPRASLRMASIERQPNRVLGCDFYEPFFAPPRVHHRDYINVLRCSGQVESFDRIVSFGPTAADCARAIRRLEH